MAIDKLIIITTDAEKIAVFSQKLNKDFNIIFTNPENFENILEQHDDYPNIVFDLTNDSIESLHKYIVLRLKYKNLRTIALVNHDLATQIKNYDNNSMYWCYGCDEYSPELLINKIKEFKKKQLSEGHRMQLLQELFKKIPVALGVVPKSNPAAGFSNIAFRTLTGYKPIEYLEMGGWNSITHPEDRYIDEDIRRIIEEDKVDHIIYEKRIIHKDGSIIWLEVFIDIFDRVDDDYVRMVMARNINKRKELQTNRDEILRRTKTLLNNLPGLAYRCKNDEYWTMEFVSEGALGLTGYKANDFIHNKELSFNEIIVKKYRRIVRDQWANIIGGNKLFEAEYKIITKSGKTKWVFERGVPIYDKDGNLEALEGIIIDISHQKKLERLLQYMNDFNQKLRLPNREMLKRKIQNVIDTKTGKGTLILINIKETQKLYRSHGYEYVELLTASLVNKLKLLEDKGEQLYYVEEDMYAILAKKKWSHDYLRECYFRIKNAILNTITREQIRCNIGITYVDKSSVYAEDFIRKARIASEFIRDDNNLLSMHLFNDEMEKKVKREDALKQELIDVSYTDNPTKLRLVFQPLIKLETGKTIGFEALARYKSEDFGQISPVEFIPIVEKNRLAVAFGKKVIDLALEFIKELLALGINDLPVSINISTLQLLDPWFVETLVEKLESTNVPANLVLIELTESVFAANYNLLNDRLKELNDLGIRAALDDFGTGFSSLSLIEQLRFNTIKIDRSFIMKLTKENVYKSTIPEIINMCKKFNLSPLAEGIETKEQYNLLLDLGCKYGQGYYMSRPLEVPDALAYIKVEKEKQ